LPDAAAVALFFASLSLQLCTHMSFLLAAGTLAGFLRCYVMLFNRKSGVFLAD